MNQLNELLHKYANSYYNDNESLVSDYEFDILVSELKELENQYPDVNLENSYSKAIGSKVDNRFTKVNHKTKMYSLDNAFDLADLRKFDAKIQKSVETYTYVCELKIDGLAINLEYGDGKLTAITRGDGVTGEDVTHNVQTIKSLPSNINNMQVRGEIFISKDEFTKINSTREKKFANPRNLASGTMRQLDNKETKKRNLDMFAYGLVNYEDYNLETYFDAMMFLKEKNFQINERIKLCNNIEEVYSYVQDIAQIRNELDYEIDGIVIKVNEYRNQQEIGYTTKFPKWAIAYKFASDIAVTKLNDIVLTVGRTGKITPNAYLEPVSLMGSIISKATLHNYIYIKDKDIRIGDFVEVIKAGDIIPRVEKVDISKRTESIYEFIFPNECPVCGSILTIIENDHFCTNILCPGRNLEGLIYFASRDCMNIDGLGEALIEKMVNQGLIKSYPDIYKITYEDLTKLEGMAELSSNNIINAIGISLNNDVVDFIAGLGIKNIGRVSAIQILKKFPDLRQWNELTEEDFSSVDKIGPIIAMELVKYFQDSSNVENISYMIEIGLNPVHETIGLIEESIYTNKTIVITGTFSSFKRTDIKKKMETLGAIVTNSISKKTDYLFVGENAGSKLTKATALGIEIVDEKRVNEIMEEI